MFSRVVTVTSLALLAVATPWNTPTTTATSTTTITVTAPAPTVTTVSQCNTGDAQCCSSTGFLQANSLSGNIILALLGIVLEDVDVLLGIDCSPLEIIGGSPICSSEPVCCTDNSVGDLISIGCVPINL